MDVEWIRFRVVPVENTQLTINQSLELLILLKFFLHLDPENINEPGPVGQNRGPLAGLSPVAFIFIALSIVFFLYQIVGGMITFLLLGDGMEVNESNVGLMRLILTFSQFMFILFPSIFLVMLQDNNIIQTFRLKKPKMSVFFVAILGILVIQPFLQVLLYYQNRILFSIPFAKDFITQLKELFDSLEATTEMLVKAGNVGEFLIIIFVIAVTPAICEEFLFRGLVFTNFEKVIPASKAVFFTGLIFALFHFHPFNIIALCVLGIFLTFVVSHSGSIYTAIACHFVNNFVSSLAAFLYGKDFTSSGSMPEMTSQEEIQFALLGIVSLAIFILIIWTIRKYSVRKANQFE